MRIHGLLSNLLVCTALCAAGTSASGPANSLDQRDVTAQDWEAAVQTWINCDGANAPRKQIILNNLKAAGDLAELAADGIQMAGRGDKSFPDWIYTTFFGTFRNHGTSLAMYRRIKPSALTEKLHIICKPTSVGDVTVCSRTTSQVLAFNLRGTSRITFCDAFYTVLRDIPGGVGTLAALAPNVADAIRQGQSSFSGQPQAQVYLFKNFRASTVLHELMHTQAVARDLVERPEDVGMNRNPRLWGAADYAYATLSTVKTLIDAPITDDQKVANADTYAMFAAAATIQFMFNTENCIGLDKRDNSSSTGGFSCAACPTGTVSTTYSAGNGTTTSHYCKPKTSCAMGEFNDPTDDFKCKKNIDDSHNYDSGNSTCKMGQQTVVKDGKTTCTNQPRYAGCPDGQDLQKDSKGVYGCAKVTCLGGSTATKVKDSYFGEMVTICQCPQGKTPQYEVDEAFGGNGTITACGGSSSSFGSTSSTALSSRASSSSATKSGSHSSLVTPSSTFRTSTVKSSSRSKSSTSSTSHTATSHTTT